MGRSVYLAPIREFECPCTNDGGRSGMLEFSMNFNGDQHPVVKGRQQGYFFDESKVIQRSGVGYDNHA